MAKPSPTSSLSSAPTVPVCLCTHCLFPSLSNTLSLLLLSSSPTHLSNMLSFFMLYIVTFYRYYKHCSLSIQFLTTSLQGLVAHASMFVHMVSCILTRILCCSYHLVIQILLKESSIEIPRVTSICLSVCLSVYLLITMCSHRAGVTCSMPL